MEFKEMLAITKKEAYRRENLPEWNDSGVVAAVLVSKQGNAYVGVSIDAQCGLGLCAERSAAAEMIKNNETEVSKMVAYYYQGKVYPPCGVCREAIKQMNPLNINADVMIAEDKIVKLADLLQYDWQSS